MEKDKSAIRTPRARFSAKRLAERAREGALIGIRYKNPLGGEGSQVGHSKGLTPDGNHFILQVSWQSRDAEGKVTKEGVIESPYPRHSILNVHPVEPVIVRMFDQ